MVGEKIMKAFLIFVFTSLCAVWAFFIIATVVTMHKANVAVANMQQVQLLPINRQMGE